MRTLLFISIVLVSGAAAGLVHGAVNLAIVEPYIDEAIGIETMGDVDEAYRAWQKGGQVLAGVVMGTAAGSLFGIVFALSRRMLPGGHDVKRAAVLAGTMWAVMFLVPFLKYPAVPPGVGDPETIGMRTALYVALVAISGCGAAAFYMIGRRAGRNGAAVAVGGYSALMAAAFLAMPPGPDAAALPADLVEGFRAASVVGVSSFWAAAALLLGSLWHRFRPDAEAGIRP